ncbi:MAG: hypothetical protein HS104_05065 [Polyangiaceae bacterium]|nr:hypothetical protein [Polyangiaceae bacterium]
MAGVLLEVEARAAEFTRATGRPIQIVRHLRTAEATGGLAALRILELRLGASIVYLYSHHGVGVRCTSTWRSGRRRTARGAVTTA